ncbi:MAG TPA: Sec-independent protein translocase protein TatB [Hyphomonadaceae bacterium]|nr:Sec-independent protein translocase protein TatB [Hyphomonadaceae bacterium]
MMPGIGFAEMVILVLVAVVVIGPKDLPLMMRKFGRFTGKMRALAFEFKQGFDELGRQAELEELRKEVAELKKHTGLEDIQNEFEKDRVNLQKDVDSALAPIAGPSHPAGAANGAAPPEMPKHAGLSAEHPGYDTGEDFRIEGPKIEDPAPEAADAPGDDPSPEASPEPQPVKQDTPA